MKVLVVCDEGNNRSVTIAGQLKYWGHDVLTVGLARNSTETLEMLVKWSDRVIITDYAQSDHPELRTQRARDKTQLWDIGPDVYPRPFNKGLLAKVKVLMQEHRAEYKP